MITSKRLPLLFLLVGGIIVLALAAFFVVNGLHTPGSTISGSSSGGQTNNGNTSNTSNSGNSEEGTGQQTPLFKNPVYVSQITSHIAQGLHLSADQIKTQLQSGKTMTEIASAQGISASQLQSIELDAFQTTFTNAVHAGAMTQATADRVMQQFKTDSQFMDSKVVMLFGGNGGGH